MPKSKQKILACATALAFIAATDTRAGQEEAEPNLPALAPLTAQDRVLVLAPHEDDETLGCGGLLQQAVAAGAQVRIVYLTYGDHNEFAFLLYRKKLWLSPTVNRNMGETRRSEAVEAMKHLGVAEQNLIFLGFPDHDTLAIWTKHWANAPPARSLLTNASRVPYRDAFSFDKPHKGEEIVAALEAQLRDFRPTRIFVTDPVDANPDHRALFLFAQVALLNLGDQTPATTVLTFPIHMGAWPRPLSSKLDASLDIPKILADARLPWSTLALTPEQTRRKQAAIRLYKTQLGDHWYWLNSFARRNELFTTRAPIPLRADRWSKLSNAVARPETEAYEQANLTSHVEGVAYRATADGPLIQIALRKPIEEELGATVYAFGYSRDKPFAAMPKLRLQWLDDRLTVFDQSAKLTRHDIHVEAAGSQITILIPWKILGDPDRIFAQAQGLIGGLPVSQTSWQLLVRPP